MASALRLAQAAASFLQQIRCVRRSAFAAPLSHASYLRCCTPTLPGGPLQIWILTLFRENSLRHMHPFIKNPCLFVSSTCRILLPRSTRHTCCRFSFRVTSSQIQCYPVHPFCDLKVIVWPNSCLVLGLSVSYTKRSSTPRSRGIAASCNDNSNVKPANNVT
ncbi:hypothetical protein DEU56DRAFT_451680 [Suillus clintonianus]|uniref:uncharacterized protein n=1 Tax=Suillus clintonianus TaxID=1904413 RepID=UPI001B87DF16|nr:uncharacterized protein DEU56DRAFT_451680 [Suillus clintonianus]KAG2131798.1 hypothetical protein DEU56DRAFT_451680 [Suillus clintonianus]